MEQKENKKDRLPLTLRFTRLCLLFGVNKLAVLLMIGVMLAYVFNAMDTPMKTGAAALLLMGLWSVGCVMFGQFLAYKRHLGQSPLPEIDEEQATSMIVNELINRNRQRSIHKPYRDTKL